MTPRTSASPQSNSLPGRWLAACCVAALSACNLGPDYQRPELPAPAAFSSADAGAAVAWPSADWWKGFGSPQLDAYIAQSQQANDDIAAAVARVRQADAQARIAGAPLLPTLDASFDASQARTQGSGGSHTGAAFSPLLSASYALDFWGKNRATREAAVAAANASRYDRATI